MKEPYTIHNSPLTSARRLRASRSGQVLIVMLGIMSFALVIGLAISSRIVTGLRQATYSTQSAQALAFAEAGAEHALQCLEAGTCGTGTSNLDINDDSTNDCTLDIDEISPGTVFNGTDGNLTIGRDEMVQINLSGYPGTSNTLRIYWAAGADEINDPKAIEASFIFSRADTGSIEMRRCAWDPVATRGNPTKLNPATDSCAGATGSYPKGEVTYRHRLTIKLSAIKGALGGVAITPQLLRIKALYGDVDNSIAVEGVGAAIPTQGYTITSTGTSGEVKRAVQVTRTSPALFEMFDYVLFEGKQ